MKKGLFWIGSVLILGVMAFEVLHKEDVLAAGQTVFLRLAPRDPRSLMQGDYMVLRYQVADQLGDSIPSAGKIILRLDDKQVGSYVALYDQQDLEPDQILLRYKRRGEHVSLGAESFFFEEGQSKRFSPAFYGELKVAPTGDSILIGLRDAHLEKL